jgi:hypothetical protein
MIESIRRFYSNSFVDAQRQEAINLFLGNYTIAKGQPTLWELTTDYYLHHIDPRFAQEKPRRYVCLSQFSELVISNGLISRIWRVLFRHLRHYHVRSLKIRRRMISYRKKCGRNITVHSQSPQFRKSSPTT